MKDTNSINRHESKQYLSILILSIDKQSLIGIKHIYRFAVSFIYLVNVGLMIIIFIDYITYFYQ